MESVRDLLSAQTDLHNPQTTSLSLSLSNSNSNHHHHQMRRPPAKENGKDGQLEDQVMTDRRIHLHTIRISRIRISASDQPQQSLLEERHQLMRRGRRLRTAWSDHSNLNHETETPMRDISEKESIEPTVTRVENANVRGIVSGTHGTPHTIDVMSVNFTASLHPLHLIRRTQTSSSEMPSGELRRNTSPALMVTIAR